ncbi:unnamed protein product [Trichobilharzia regenti]|nr:unnamed protein product [Trichobilharzia regenti]
MSTNTGSSDLFSTFYEEVKAIEKRDSVLTPKQQIDRLNRPGSTYFNLNPYDVLQVDPDTSMADIKKKYRQMIEKRKRLKKSGGPTTIEEDDPDKVSSSARICV